MRTLFLLNPAAGKQDCTAQLIPQIEAAARRAGLAPAAYRLSSPAASRAGEPWQWNSTVSSPV